MNKRVLEAILMQNDVEDAINRHLDQLLEIIPELKDMIGFEHKHPHHHLDVWNHTLLALSKSPLDFEIRLILLLHDIGKPHSFQEDGEVRHFKGHPLVSKEISRKILERLEFDDEDVEEMCYLIEKHDYLLTYKEIRNKNYLARKMFKIQYCDALAHHPDKLEKRINYLIQINNLINEKETKARYNRQLNNLLKKDSRFY